MDERVFTDTGYTKTPAFAKVYEQLYRLITTGKLPANGLLPAETALAEQYGVSRNTLRQALAILREDGLIYNVKGKGNFVVRAPKGGIVGYERLSNPIFTAAVDGNGIGTTMHYFFYPTADVVQEKLLISQSDLAIIANLEYEQNGVGIAYVFMEVPVKRIEKLHLDLADAAVVEKLLNEGVYAAAAQAQSRLTLTEAEESIANYLKVSAGTSVLFIEEILFDADGTPLALCKQYLLPGYYSIRFVRHSEGV